MKGQLWYSGVVGWREIQVIDAIRDAFGRMYTRGGEEWLDSIPEDA